MTRFTRVEFRLLSIANVFAEFRAIIKKAGEALDSDNPDWSVAMPEYFDSATVTEEDETVLVEEVRDVLNKLSDMLRQTEEDMIYTTVSRYRGENLN